MGDLALILSRAKRHDGAASKVLRMFAHAEHTI
jgi:hypothetical protein